MDYYIPPIKLKEKCLGTGFPVYIIAEIGSNHDGDLNRAKDLIRLAKKAGADAAKFQSFSPQTLLNPSCKANGNWTPDQAWPVIERLSLPLEWHAELKKEADKMGIDFISTPFDLDRLALLLELDVPVIKIASGDLTYHELIKAAGLSGKPVFLSTGHATLGEVEAALNVLWEAGCKDIVVLHCASLYPTPFEDANLTAMNLMQKGFQVLVGYSDHTPGHTVTLGAVALGASVIEKHLTDDKLRKGPDHPFALDGKEFTEMTTQIRNLEKALIRGVKSPRFSERAERVMARRALYALTTIPKGTVIGRDQIKVVRHCYKEGIPADQLEKVKETIAKVDIQENDLITWEMVQWPIPKS